MRVVASFTTLPSRINLIIPMVTSIACQTRKPDRFILWVPPYCNKEDAEYELKDDVRESLSYYGVEICCCEVDWGPVTKLIPTLKAETNTDTLIVTLDDDVIYEKHVLELFEKASVIHPGSALGLMGSIGKRYLHCEELFELNVMAINVDGLGGYRGVAYRRGLFDNSIFEDISAMINVGIFTVDDQLISWNLFRRGIPMKVIRGEPSISHNEMSSMVTNIGVGIHMGADKKNRELASDSLKRLKAMYDKNNWRRPV